MALIKIKFLQTDLQGFPVGVCSFNLQEHEQDYSLW